MLMLLGLKDRILSSGTYRGEVVNLDNGVHRVCYVYGKTLEEMRKRKRIIRDALDQDIKKSELEFKDYGINI